MIRKRYVLLVVLTIVSGFFGGVVSEQFSHGRPAIAQANQVPVYPVLSTNLLRVVDSRGRIRVEIGEQGGEIALNIADATGLKRIQLGVATSGNPIFSMDDASGEPGVLGIVSATGPAIHLQQGKAHVSMAIAPTKAGSISIGNAQGQKKTISIP